jgi:hypothetical protein
MAANVLDFPNLNQPPAKLRLTGRRLWQQITSTYEFDDPGSYELLSQCCQAADRITELSKLIEKEGYTSTLLAYELSHRRFVVSTLKGLGLDLEPVHDRPGRPTGK